MSGAMLMVAVLALIAGLGLGCWLTVLWQRRRSGGATLAEMQREQELFREQVTNHFATTAELVNKLTDSYKAVFDHLSSGAQQLADADKLRERLPHVEGEAVTLKRIGSGLSDSPLRPDARPASARQSSSLPRQAGYPDPDHHEDTGTAR